MLYGILGDIHSNYDALSAVLKDMKNFGVEEYCSVGDIVGYGAEPAICIDTLKNLNCLITAGNHDYAVAEQISIDNFNIEARESILWTRDNLSKEYLDFLSALPLVVENDYFTVVHGTLHEPLKFLYMTNFGLAKISFKILETNLCFIGHTHTPMAFLYKNGKISYTTNDEIDINDAQKFIINAGSVGQPRDRDPGASYILFDSTKKTLSFKRVIYDVETAANKIFAAGLPIKNGLRLSIGA